jgi:hypothetical protein
MSWFKEVAKLVVSAIAVKWIWWAFRRWQRSRQLRGRAPTP